MHPILFDSFWPGFQLSTCQAPDDQSLIIQLEPCPEFTSPCGQCHQPSPLIDDRLLPPTGMQLIMFMQDPVEGGFRGQIVALVQLIRDDKRRWAAAILRLIAERYHGFALLL